MRDEPSEPGGVAAGSDQAPPGGSPAADRGDVRETGPQALWPPREEAAQADAPAGRRRTVRRSIRLPGRTALGRLVGAYFTAAQAEMSDAAALHAFRIQGKQVRYAMEIFAGAFDDDFRGQLYPLVVTLQERLGAVNDHVTAQSYFVAWHNDADSVAVQRIFRAGHRPRADRRGRQSPRVSRLVVARATRRTGRPLCSLRGPVSPGRQRDPRTARRAAGRLNSPRARDRASRGRASGGVRRHRRNDGLHEPAAAVVPAIAREAAPLDVDQEAGPIGLGQFQRSDHPPIGRSVADVIKAQAAARKDVLPTTATVSPVGRERPRQPASGTAMRIRKPLIDPALDDATLRIYAGQHAPDLLPHDFVALRVRFEDVWIVRKTNACAHGDHPPVMRSRIDRPDACTVSAATTPAAVGSLSSALKHHGTCRRADELCLRGQIGRNMGLARRAMPVRTPPKDILGRNRGVVKEFSLPRELTRFHGNKSAASSGRRGQRGRSPSANQVEFASSVHCGFRADKLLRPPRQIFPGRSTADRTPSPADWPRPRRPSDSLRIRSHRD